jgi:hypothetical protein
MATTETRPGFRLPWTSDHREPRAGDDAGTTEPQAEAATSGETTVDPSPASQASTTESPEDSVTPTFAASSTPTSSATDGHPGTVPPASHPTPPPARPRPTKFLADLTKAMQTAAQAEREEMLRQYREDAKAFVEQYRSEAAVRVTSYRKEADEDVAGIRDWSKAEMARIREETERRIASRKADLESELQYHGDRVDRAIQGIESRVEGYETEMAAFFERLLAVDDPTAFAAMAANMPEPPLFSSEPMATEAPASSEAADAPSARTAQPGPAGPETVAPDATDADEIWSRPDEAPASAEAAGDEAAARVDPSAADSAWAGATWSNEAGASGDGDGHEPGAVDAETGATLVTDDHRPASAAPATTLPPGLTEEPVDPRLAALGLTPDFAAAEAEAAVDLSGDGSDDAEGVVPVDDEALAARIAGLVAVSGAGTIPTGETRTTQIVVVGLVSVASIAGFKRNLARVEGVQSVSVSSGPDGEFIFSTVHHDADLASAIAALPGFDARVAEGDGGTLHVAAHDPESAA